jgi:hypothetical protein
LSASGGWAGAAARLGTGLGGCRGAGCGRGGLPARPLGRGWRGGGNPCGHSSGGGDFFGGGWSWLDLTAGLFNNLNFADALTWRLEADQATVTPRTAAFSIPWPLEDGRDAFATGS